MIEQASFVAPSTKGARPPRSNTRAACPRRCPPGPAAVWSVIPNRASAPCWFPCHPTPSGSRPVIQPRMPSAIEGLEEDVAGGAGAGHPPARAQLDREPARAGHRDARHRWPAEGDGDRAAERLLRGGDEVVRPRSGSHGEQAGPSRPGLAGVSTPRRRSAVRFRGRRRTIGGTALAARRGRGSPRRSRARTSRVESGARAPPPPPLGKGWESLSRHKPPRSRGSPAERSGARGRGSMPGCAGGLMGRMRRRT